MKKRILILLAIVILVAMPATGCVGQQKKTDVLGEDGNNAERTITDLAGNTVKIPVPEKIDRVVIIAPPLLSTYISTAQDPKKLVGVHPTAFNDANQELLDLMVPNNKKINTTFLTGYESNVEELLKLEPDIVLVYGEAQKKGLENIQIPVVDFFIKNQINEDWSVQIDELMREIFSLDGDNSLQKEWDIAKQNVAQILSEAKGKETQKGLMIMSNTEDKVMVRGAGSYGDDWLLKSGLSNVASELTGDNIEVTMEQIYRWNPDIIYVFRGLPADDYLSGTIKGQDWSQTAAFKNGRIYDIPKGMINWGTPCADSPLMIQWLVSKNFPDKLSIKDFTSVMKEFYKSRYGIDMTDELADSILNPNEGKSASL